MAGVRLESVTKKFGNVVALKDCTLEIVDGEFMVLVGPSGCGKTTALRIVAGLDEQTSGNVFIDDRLVNNVASKDRDIAMVFQAYALYPHMSVFDNMAFGLRVRTMGSWWWRLSHPRQAAERKARIEQKVRAAAELLGIEELLHRRPRELSGGQRQRVALGRAIVREPKVFLMDEPLSNLDAKLRVQTRAELIRLHRRLGITTIYVTHDQVEAMTMGDRIAVMKDGVLQQVATPGELYRNPANTFVASFMGSPPMNLITLDVIEGKATLGGALIPVPVSQEKIILGIRPEDLRLDGEGFSVRATVDVVEPLGATQLVMLSTNGATMIASMDADTVAADGTDIDLRIAGEKLHFFNAETGQAIP